MVFDFASFNTRQKSCIENSSFSFWLMGNKNKQSVFNLKHLSLYKLLLLIVSDSQIITTWIKNFFVKNDK